jgi:pimeloyl-ACP methyl ester carboxylesterase
MTAAPPAPGRRQGPEVGSPGKDSRPRRHIVWLVVASLAAGLAAGLVLVSVPFVPAEESQLTGALLCGFALGWALLAGLSVRFSDQPQRWAVVPALFMGLGGLLLLGFGSSVQGVLKWVWPPGLAVLVVWMIMRTRRDLRSPSRRWLLYPVFASLLLTSVGGAYETVSEAAEPADSTMPGQLVDIGGHSLHLNCTGSGSPTVLLEPGAGAMSSAFGWVAPPIARTTRVCAYDRAGRGWSEPADTVQDATQIATDLHTLLERAGIPGPYVPVGHSFGGLYVLAFADLYPEDVAGMVVVDSTAPAFADPAPDAGPHHTQDAGSATDRISALLSSTAHIGLSRLIDQVDDHTLPARSEDEMRASTTTATYMQSVLEEYIHTSRSTRAAAALDDFGDKPLVILTAGTGSNAAWFTAQDHLATLSTNTSHRVIDDAVHAAFLHDEQYAATTTRATLDVLTSLRNDQPLED